MAEMVRKNTVEVRILPGGDEAIVISDSAGDEIIWTAERDGVEYDIKFPNATPFTDSGGQPKSSFKARKGNPDSTGKGHYQAGGENVYHYEIHPPQPTVWDATTQGPRPSAGPALKDPIVIVDP